MKLSLAIPTYECNGRGVEFLDFQFKRFATQTFKDFQVVISDQSKDDKISDFCKKNSYDLNIKYFKNENPYGNFSENTNNSIKNCDGDIIKIIFQDDFLYNEKSLQKTVSSFSDDVNWLVSSCNHTYDDGKSFTDFFNPVYHNTIYLGNNSIGCPSVLSIRNRGNIHLFDERLVWLMDVDYYKTMFNTYGNPKILNETTVTIRVGSNQFSRVISDEVKNREQYIVSRKHEQ